MSHGWMVLINVLNDLKSHLHDVRQVLDLLRLHGLCVNPDKCFFSATKLDYLSIKVSGPGCVALVKHTEIISALWTRYLSRVFRNSEFLQEILERSCRFTFSSD